MLSQEDIDLRAEEQRDRKASKAIQVGEVGVATHTIINPAKPAAGNQSTIGQLKNLFPNREEEGHDQGRQLTVVEETGSGEDELRSADVQSQVVTTMWTNPPLRQACT